MLLHKKGIFLPLFVIVNILIFIVLAFIIRSEALNKQDLVGLRSINIIKTYDESEKAHFYLELATKQAYETSKLKIADSGGYAEANRCEKSEEFIIWNTCQILSPRAELTYQIRTDLKPYLENYESNYKKTDTEKLFNVKKEDIKFEVPEGTEDQYNYIYTKNIKELNVENTLKIGNNIIFKFSEIQYPIELSSGSIIKQNPRIKVRFDNINSYQVLYTTIESNCINKEFENCKKKLNEKFTNIEIFKEENLIKIKLPLEISAIKFAFYDNKPLQGYQDFYEDIEEGEDAGYESDKVEKSSGFLKEGESLLDSLDLKGAKIIKKITPELKVGSKRSKVSMIVLHHTGEAKATYTLSTLKERGLSVHYVLERNGDLYVFVPEDTIAYHAGCCQNQFYNENTKEWITAKCCKELTTGSEINCKNRSKFCIQGINSKSIGIEILNSGRINDPITEAQYNTLNQILPYLTKKLNIPYDDNHIVAHYEVKSSKDDPRNLDWSRINLPNHPKYSSYLKPRDFTSQ